MNEIFSPNKIGVVICGPCVQVLHRPDLLAPVNAMPRKKNFKKKRKNPTEQRFIDNWANIKMMAPSTKFYLISPDEFPKWKRFSSMRYLPTDSNKAPSSCSVIVYARPRTGMRGPRWLLRSTKLAASASHGHLLTYPAVGHKPDVPQLLLHIAWAQIVEMASCLSVYLVCACRLAYALL